MKMIKLSDGCFVASDTISEVKVQHDRNNIIVRTKDGIGHVHKAGYGMSLWREADRLIAEINEAENNK